MKRPPHRARDSARIPLGVGSLYASEGSHIGHFYESQQQWLDVLSGFFRTGIGRGDKCVFLAGSSNSIDVLTANLEATGIDVAARRQAGQFFMCEGFSDPAEVRENLRLCLNQVPGEYPLLRWAGEMTWGMSKLPDSCELMEWETHCNLVEDPQAIFLCQYNVRQFSGSVVMDAFKTHPLCIIGDAIHQNPVYVEPQAYLAELRTREAHSWT